MLVVIYNQSVSPKAFNWDRKLLQELVKAKDSTVHGIILNFLKNNYVKSYTREFDCPMDCIGFKESLSLGK